MISFVHLSDIHFTKWSKGSFDIDSDLRNEIIEKTWNSGKIIDKASRTENLMSLRNKELITWMKQE